MQLTLLEQCLLRSISIYVRVAMWMPGKCTACSDCLHKQILSCHSGHCFDHARGLDLTGAAFLNHNSCGLSFGYCPLQPNRFGEPENDGSTVMTAVKTSGLLAC